MKLTLEQALQKGIEARKNGQIQKANKHFTDILGVQPINIPLEQRLQNDFLDEPLDLERLPKGKISSRKYLKKTKKISISWNCLLISFKFLSISSTSIPLL